jgi:hypothetical protein
MSMDVEALSKALTGYGAGREVQFSEDGHSFWPIKEIALVGDRVVLFPVVDMKENNL